MKISGVKLVPVLVAAVAAYIVGAVIYGALFSAQWMEWTNQTEDSFKGNEWRMFLSWIMPLAMSFGLAKKMNAYNISTWLSGAKTGAALGLLLVVACRMYTFVYSTEPWQLFALDGVHIILAATVAGAVLGAMKVGAD